MRAPKITISIDDGHPLDLKAAKILLEKNIKTTFYIPIKNSTGRPTLNRKEIKWLSQQPNFEIGGHTFNHIDLTGVSLEVAEEEMRNGKEALENIIGKKVTTFAWPWGKYNSDLIKRARVIGFLDCRSASIFGITPINKAGYLWHPNLHIFPHSTIASLRHCIKRADLPSVYWRLKNLKQSHLDCTSILKFNNASTHFWFHSWEIEKLSLWKLLKTM